MCSHSVIPAQFRSGSWLVLRLWTLVEQETSWGLLPIPSENEWVPELPRPLSLSTGEQNYSWEGRGLLSAGGPAVLEVCGESRSLGRSPCVLAARCPTVISVSVHSISRALTFTAGANSTHPCFFWRGISSVVSLRDWEIRGTF